MRKNNTWRIYSWFSRMGFGVLMCLLLVLGFPEVATTQPLQIPVADLIKKEIRSMVTNSRFEGASDRLAHLRNLLETIRSDTFSRNDLNQKDLQLIEYVGVTHRLQQERDREQPNPQRVRQLEKRQKRINLQYQILSLVESLEKKGLPVEGDDSTVSFQIQRILQDDQEEQEQWLREISNLDGSERNKALKKFVQLEQALEQWKSLSAKQR